MADLAALPNLEQSVAAFRTAFSELLVNKDNRNPSYTDADAVSRAVASWADFVDGGIAALQSDVAGRVVDGILRYGTSRIIRTTSNPEGALTGIVGDVAVLVDGANTAIYLKATGSGNTGWASIGAAEPATGMQAVGLDSGFTGSTADTTAWVTGASTNLGTRALVDWLVRSDDGTDGSEFRIDYPGVYAVTGEIYCRYSAATGTCQFAVTLDGDGTIDANFADATALAHGRRHIPADASFTDSISITGHAMITPAIAASPTAGIIRLQVSGGGGAVPGDVLDESLCGIKIKRVGECTG